MPSDPQAHELQVVDLRQYTLHPGRRDELIRLFEREFVETQAAVGMPVLGTFTDLDDPDRFVWLRGFADMASRAESLAAFYGGPVWKAHRDAANATMLDSDDVLLLRPAPGWAWPAQRSNPRAGPDAVVLALIVPCTDMPPLAAQQLLRQAVAALGQLDAPALAALVTEPSPNNFPRLPVREGEPVLAVMAALRGPSAEARSTHCREALLDSLPAGSAVLRLAPTPRSCFPT